MELVILIAVIGGVVFLAKFGMAYLQSIKMQTGYNPTGFVNSLLIIGIFVCPILGLWLADSSGNEFGMALAFGSLLCLAGLVVRNMVLKNPVQIVLVTLFQVIAPALTLLGIIYKRSGGIMGNAVTQANLGGSGAVVHDSVTRRSSARDYTSGQDDLARKYGFADAEEAARNGMDMKKLM